MDGPLRRKKPPKENGTRKIARLVCLSFRCWPSWGRFFVSHPLR
jgi:hypothetical protein